MFTTGQKVVCIDDEFTEFIKVRYSALPTKNSIYTVRDVVLGCNYQGEAGEVAIYLEELINPANQAGTERGFNAERFAPLIHDVGGIRYEEHEYNHG